MVQIIDTFSQIGEVFCNGRFDLKRWREYINTIYRNTSDIFEDDLKEYVDSGNYTYEDDILPILNRVQVILSWKRSILPLFVLQRV